jgi:hypothetical protein
MAADIQPHIATLLAEWPTSTFAHLCAQIKQVHRLHHNEWLTADGVARALGMSGQNGPLHDDLRSGTVYGILASRKDGRKTGYQITEFGEQLIRYPDMETQLSTAIVLALERTYRVAVEESWDMANYAQLRKDLDYRKVKQPNLRAWVCVMNQPLLQAARANDLTNVVRELTTPTKVMNRPRWDSTDTPRDAKRAHVFTPPSASEPDAEPVVRAPAPSPSPTVIATRAVPTEPRPVHIHIHLDLGQLSHDS